DFDARTALLLKLGSPHRRGSQVVRQRSAKPLFGGSIPPRASNTLFPYEINCSRRSLPRRSTASINYCSDYALRPFVARSADAAAQANVRRALRSAAALPWLGAASLLMTISRRRYSSDSR